MANEKRLIDANALLESVEGTDWYTIRVDGSYTQGAPTEEVAWYKATDIYAAVENAPTVDAVEVVHGRWEKQQGLYSCSECGKTCPYDVQADTIMYWTCNYCPNCGSKMDGERKDNERKAD